MFLSACGASWFLFHPLPPKDEAQLKIIRLERSSPKNTNITTANKNWQSKKKNKKDSEASKQPQVFCQVASPSPAHAEPLPFQTENTNNSTGVSPPHHPVTLSASSTLGPNKHPTADNPWPARSSKHKHIDTWRV